jgi:hypothetical protein
VADYETSGMNRDAVRIHVMIAADAHHQGELGPWRVTTAQGALEPAIRTARPDLLILQASLVTPELAILLDGAEFADMPLVLLAGEADADAAGLLLDRPLILLESPPAPGALAEAVEAGAARIAGGVADAAGRYDPESRLEALKRDAARVAAALAELAGGTTAEPVRPVTAARIRAHVKARRNRERFFASELFADPVWDILLDLAASRLEARPVSVSSLCIAASVPTTTALRTIKQMVDRGLLVRRGDPTDARRTFIAMSATAERGMDGCLDAVLNQPGL